jgi:hypothetical protein
MDLQFVPTILDLSEVLLRNVWPYNGAIVSLILCCSAIRSHRNAARVRVILSPLVPIASAPKSRLTDIDYVKVYCDAPRAILVRRTLGEWVYKEDGHAEDRGNPVEAIRILEFAKLVLVNETGEGVLIS